MCKESDGSDGALKRCLPSKLNLPSKLKSIFLSLSLYIKLPKTGKCIQGVLMAAHMKPSIETLVRTSKHFVLAAGVPCA